MEGKSNLECYCDIIAKFKELHEEKKVKELLIPAFFIIEKHKISAIENIKTTTNTINGVFYILTIRL